MTNNPKKSSQTSGSALVFELATEEIPAKYQQNLQNDWAKRLPALFKATGIAYSGVEVLASARRIAFSIEAIEAQGSDTSETLQGPAKGVALNADGKPAPALIGFAKKAGLPPDKITFEDSAKGSYAVAHIVRKGKALQEVLPGILHELISGYRFPRSMRWADLTTTYARPILGYFLQYGAKPLTLAKEVLDGNILREIPFHSLRGHFILDHEPIELKDAADYVSVLAARGIHMNSAERRSLISADLTKVAESEKLALIENNDLLDEVNYLVEQPSVVVGSFSEDFLRLPESVILSELNQHQRYFGMRTAAGALSNKFLIVANNAGSAEITQKNIRSGNERVVRSRLSDGAFFFDEDLKRPLPDRVADLATLVFHEGLKTYLEKATRLAGFAEFLAPKGVDLTALRTAATLSKADLTTALVYEFDHLQGEIGAVYARSAEIAEPVCVAIHEHYLPRFQGDSLPKSMLGALVSLADKWDNIMAAFILGKEPTASQDPFAIRRQSLYFIQIVVAQKLTVSLAELLKESYKVYAPVKNIPDDAQKATTEKILLFLKARLATIFESEGFDKKLSRAAIFSGSDDVYDLFARASALRSIADRDFASFQALLTAFKRMANITSEHSAKSTLDPSLFKKPQENALYDFSKKLEAKSKAPEPDPTARYTGIFEEFASGKMVVDAFFSEVMVNDEDLAVRNNRMALLSQILSVVRGLIALEELT
jgi:glycyl-tRNA synthetase beta chain